MAFAGCISYLYFIYIKTSFICAAGNFTAQFIPQNVGWKYLPNKLKFTLISESCWSCCTCNKLHAIRHWQTSSQKV